MLRPKETIFLLRAGSMDLLMASIVGSGGLPYRSFLPPNVPLGKGFSEQLRCMNSARNIQALIPELSQ
jgi:hypothetical protein